VQLELKIANRTCHYNGMQYAFLADGTNSGAYVQCCVFTLSVAVYVMDTECIV